MKAQFIGVDGASIRSKRNGWAVVGLDESGFVCAEFHEQFEEILLAYPEPCVLAVDIPIGLSKTADRTADVEARRLLGPRSSSVFSAPVRPVLRAESYSDACALSEQACGKKISRQAWALVERIRQVDRHCSEQRLHEVHPEVSFRFLAGAPPAFSKKSWGGQAERRRLLEGVGIILPEDLGEVSAVCADDILDAAVAAWTARRIAEGSSVSIPEDPIERDGTRDIVIRA